MLGKHPREENSGVSEEMARRTLRFVLSVAVEKVFPSRRLIGGHAVGKGYWYRFHGEEGPVQKADTEKISAEMQLLIKGSHPIVSSERPYSQVLGYFQQSAQVLAAQLIEKRVPIGGSVKVSNRRPCTNVLSEIPCIFHSASLYDFVSLPGLDPILGWQGVPSVEPVQSGRLHRPSCRPKRGILAGSLCFWRLPPRVGRKARRPASHFRLDWRAARLGKALRACFHRRCKYIAVRFARHGRTGREKEGKRTRGRGRRAIPHRCACRARRGAYAHRAPRGASVRRGRCGGPGTITAATWIFVAESIAR